MSEFRTVKCTMAKTLILFLSMCIIVQGDYDLFTSPATTFFQGLAGFQLDNRVTDQNGVQAERLPVNGFG
ncbi:unnamed protein product [Colias eurytheme]|nr:unnamed protein product [Colias eurytheme]